MKRFFPLLLFVLLVCLFFQPVFIKQLLPIPSDTIIGLYHPFRDLYAKDYPRGIPYKNFLITDPVLQQYPWKSLAITLGKHGELPLWNPYSFSGMPLLANLQSAVWYPLNVLFFLLPFPLAWSILIISQPLFAGIFMYLYLRNLKLSHLSSVLGSLVFAFSGFSLVWLEWGTVMQTGLWLPLILLATDKLFTAKHKKEVVVWSSLFVTSLTASFFAGHVQTFFYGGFVTFLYICARAYQYKNASKFILFGSLFFVFVILAIPQWVSLLQLIQLSARNIDHINYTTAGWFVPWQHLAQFIAPDFFGNPATLNYWGVWNYMEFSGYVGLFPLLLAVFSLLFIKMKKVYFFGVLCITSLVFALPNPISQLPFILHIPFIETSQPTRLLFVTDFSLSVLAAIGLSSVKSITKKIWITLTFITLLLLALWVIILLHEKIGLLAENAIVAKQNLIFPTVILFLVFISILVFQCIKQQKMRSVLFPLIVIVITCLDLFRFGYKFTPFTPAVYLFPQTKTLLFMKEHVGNSRIMETSREVMSPNIAVTYGLQSVDGYDPLYLQRYGEFIAASERGKPDIHPPFGFNRIITPHNYTSSLINLLGVKYILSLQDIQDKNFKKVFEENETKVYENTQALPRAFFVDRIMMANSKQDAIDKLFGIQNNLSDVAIVENSQKLNGNYSQGAIEITNYSANTVSVTTQNSGKGFLVLTDVYYPTWHVSIDGKPSNIFLTDFTFRGVEVPAGNHTVVFRDSLL